MLETKSGQVQGAFHRDDLGEINLVWGQVTDAKKHKGYGLAHIVDKHGEQAARQIPQIIKDGKLARDTQGRLRIETQSHIVGINDTYGDEKIGHWIVTSYEKKGDGVSSSTSSPITTPKVQGENPLNEIIPNSQKQSQAPQKSLLEQARENTERLRAAQEAEQIAQKEAELARLKEMQAKNAEILAQKEAAANKAINEAQSLEIGTPIKAQKISDTKIIINDNTAPFKAEFIIAKKDDIKPNFERTGTQGRSQRQDKVIESIQSDFKPHLIFEQMGGFEGLPIILKDGQVIAGNHRAQAIKGLTGEQLARYKQAAKEKFGVDLKDDEVIVRLVKDGDEKELINLAFMSNVGRESNLGEKALANLAKYDSQIQALPSRINAESVFELESQVAKALDTQGNGLNVFDTNLALFSRLAKSTQNANILDSLNALKNLSQDEKEKVLRMFVSNAGEFHNLAKDTQLKSLNLNDYLADALIVAAKNVDSSRRAANYAKLLDDIITMQASAKEMLKIDPFLFENFKSKALGYALARFARLENPSAKLFEFLKASKADLENLYTGNIFESNKAISDIDIYDFLKHAINSGDDLMDNGVNLKHAITSKLDDLRKVENALIDSGEIQFAKSKAKPQGREAKETNINSLFADDELQMQATKPTKELNLSDEKDFNELGEFFKLNLKDKEFNEIYNKAAATAQRLGVKVRFDESAARSHFILNDNTITIAAANKEHFQAQDLLHELIHATTRKALKDFSQSPEQAAKIYTKRQIEAINEIISLYQKSKGIAKRQGKDAYALQNVDEFVAELSSSEFRAFLKAQDIFERFIKALIRFFTGDSERLAKNVNSYKALKESYYKILDDYEPPLAPQKIADERALKSVDKLNLSENLGKSQGTNAQEPKILSEMQRIQKISLMKDLPEPTPAQQKKINTLKSMLEKRQNELKEVQDKIDKMPNAFSRFNSNNSKRAREKSLHDKKKALNLKIQDIKEQLAKIDNTMPKKERYFADKGEVWNNSMKAQMRDLEPISDYELAKKSLLKYENTIKAREWAEFYYNTQPLKEFGTNYAEFYRDGQGAVKKLLAEKQGQVAGAFYRDDLAKATGTGEIDLVWGDSTKGLQHILERRAADFETQGLTKEQATQKALEFVENDLNEIFQNGKATIQNNRAVIDTGDKMGIIALDYFGKDRKWIITAYNKYNASPSHSAGFAQNETLSHSNQLTSAKTGLDNVNSSENLAKSQADESQILSAYDKNVLENAPKETIEAHLKSIEKDIDYLEKGIDFYKKNPEQDYNGEMIKFNEKLLTPKLQMQKAYKQRLDELNSLDLSYAPKRSADEIQITLPKEKQTRFTMRQNAYKSLKEVEKTPLTNANDGRVAYLNKTGRQESLSDYAINESAKNGFDEAQHLATAQHLPTLFENAKFKETTRDLKNNDKNVKIHRYTANFLLDNEPAQAQITLKETIAGQHSGNKIYTLKLESVSRLSPAEPQNPREALSAINDPKSSGFGEPSTKPSEIVSKIQKKFKFDEKKAKDLYEWHKDSSPLTKNDDGTPKVFYHGAKVAKGADIEIFDTKFANGNYEHGQIKNLPFGFFFSSDLKTAKGYTYNDNELVKNVFLKLENPLVIDFGGKTYNQGIDDAISQMSQEFKKGTHDSIIYKNIIDDSTQDKAKKHKVADTIIVFDSKQIKSIDNTGSWTDSAGKTTKEKPSDESARHSYFNAQSPNILHSNEIWGGGLAGGTLNGLETDEDGNIIGFDPAKFVAGFIAGAAGTKAVKSLFENPKFKANAQKFAIIQRIKAKRENTMKYNTFKKIDESQKYGSKMKLIGAENLNADIIAYALSKNKRFAVNKLDEQTAKALNFKYPNDVRRTIQPDEVIHTLKRHGENSNLVKFSGQKPVTLDDIAKYQHYADNAKDKGLSFDKQGNEILVSFKRLDNDFYVVVEQIRKSQNELGFKDLYFGTGEFDESKLGKKISLPASS